MKKEIIYQKRRNDLIEKYGRTLFVISSGQSAYRSHSVAYRFKVAADFHYLTGLQISDAVLIVSKEKTYLLQNDQQDHIWGEFSGLQNDEHNLLNGLSLESIENLKNILSEISNQFDRIAVSFGRDQNTERAALEAIQFQRRAGRSRNYALEICDSRTLVGSLRAIKDDTEIASMKEAGRRSSEVHQLLMQQNLIGRSERDISNWIEAQFLLRNMQWPSYETIVGTGRRSTILHARATDDIIQKDQVVLVDAGAEWKGYCADITRTLPSGFKFSENERKIYQIVLEAQKSALKMIRPGVTLQQIHQGVLDVFQERLQTRMDLKKLMPHSTSHWIGLDVHDPCAYLDDAGQAITLKTGMCFTVEPGLYFNQIEGFEKYNGIGVRIEDDVVVTDTGYESLTTVQKEVEEIEELRALSHTR